MADSTWSACRVLYPLATVLGLMQSMCKKAGLPESTIDYIKSSDVGWEHISMRTMVLEEAEYGSTKGATVFTDRLAEPQRSQSLCLDRRNPGRLNRQIERIECTEQAVMVSLQA